VQIGRAGEPVTRISRAFPDRVEVRGRDLTGDLMGRLSFTEYFHLLLTGKEPSEDQRFFLDLLLLSIAEHGLMPSNVAARVTLAADPDSLQGAVASGILGEEPETVAADVAREVHAAGRRMPGFGHPLHRPVDPRAERIVELADERGVAGPHLELTRILRSAVAAEWGRPLTVNVSLPIAAVMLDLGYSPDVVKAVPILARTAGLLAHLAEEREHPIGFLLAAEAEEAIEYRDG